MELKYKIHFIYIISILVSIIICLISIEWSEVEGLVDYITFALTLSSLILAGLAIIYSIYSNTSIGSSLGKISNAAAEISEASGDLKASNLELKAEVQQLPKKIDAVDRSVNTTHKKLLELAEIKVLNTEQPTSNHHTETEVDIRSEDVKNFLNNSSIRGLEFLYMAHLSLMTKTSFSIDEVIIEIKKKVENYEYQDYLLAYQVASKAFSIISYTRDAQDRDTYTFIHEEIRNNVEKTLVRKTKEVAYAVYAASDDDEQSVKEKVMSSLTTIQEISRYFGKSTDINKLMD